MSPILVSLIALVAILSGALFRAPRRKTLPERHLADDTRDLSIVAA